MKRIISVILLIVLVCLTFASCGENKDAETEHKHSIVTVRGRSATCTEDGSITYTAKFSNSAFETKTKTVEGEKATGHMYVFKGWTWADDHSYAIAKFVCVNDNCGHVKNVKKTATKGPLYNL